MSKPLTSRRYKNASGRESYEIFDASSDFLATIAGILNTSFGFRQHGKTLAGLDTVYMDFSNGEVELILGWNNWSGCFLDAREPAGDTHVVAIGQHLDTLLSQLS